MPLALALPEVGGAAAQARPPTRDLVGRTVLDRLRVELSLEPRLRATRPAYVLGQLGRDAVGEPADQVPVRRGQQLVLARGACAACSRRGPPGPRRRGRRCRRAQRRRGRRTWPPGGYAALPLGGARGSGHGGWAPEGVKAGVRSDPGGRRSQASGGRRGCGPVVRKGQGDDRPRRSSPLSSFSCGWSSGAAESRLLVIRSVGVTVYGLCASRYERSESMSRPPISLFVPLR